MTDAPPCDHGFRGMQCDPERVGELTVGGTNPRSRPDYFVPLTAGSSVAKEVESGALRRLLGDYWETDLR